MSEYKVKKVVIIGGGNGSAFSICALKPLVSKIELFAVVSMSDSGGSTGRLRQEFNTLPPGDILRAVLAMSPVDYKIIKKIFYKNRFSGCGKLDGHNLGNLFLVLSESYNKDYLASLRALGQAVNAVGDVYPVTLDKCDLAAELSNGDIVRGEATIDEPSYDRNLKIKKAWLDPDVSAYAGAIQAIKDADVIVLGPGSLYTSIIAALLPRGIKEAIGESKAKLIYITGNAIHANGETGPETVSGLVSDLRKYLPRKIDIVLFNLRQLNETQKKYYEEKGWKELIVDRENWAGLNMIEDDYEREGGGLCAEKLEKILGRILTDINEY